jgi:hypothetical protein
LAPDCVEELRLLPMTYAVSLAMLGMTAVLVLADLIEPVQLLLPQRTGDVPAVQGQQRDEVEGEQGQVHRPHQPHQGTYAVSLAMLGMTAVLVLADLIEPVQLL